MLLRTWLFARLKPVTPLTTLTAQLHCIVASKWPCNHLLSHILLQFWGMGFSVDKLPWTKLSATRLRMLCFPALRGRITPSTTHRSGGRLLRPLFVRLEMQVCNLFFVGGRRLLPLTFHCMCIALRGTLPSGSLRTTRQVLPEAKDASVPS
jgi:hypothetical protein